MKNAINPIKFHSSGLYRPFYKVRQIDFGSNESLRKKVSYNADLLLEFWEDKQASSEANLTEEEKKEIVEKLFWEDLSYQTYFEPLVFCERTALECGLLPFNYILCEGSLLAIPLSDYSKGQDFSGRLAAYQVLTHETIDPLCSFHENKKYFEDIVGKDIVDRMEKILYEDQPETRN